MKTHARPLPDSLTRYLAGRSSHASRTPRSAEGTADSAERRSGHRALDALLLRGFVYALSGLVWLFVLGLVLRHAAR